MTAARNELSTSSALSNMADMFSVTLVTQGYARIGLKNSTEQKLVKVSNTIEYIYGVAELTSEYIILITRHYMRNGQFMDYIERTA